MSMKPKPRSKSYEAAYDQRGELLTPWLIAVAMGLAILVLFGSIERNLEISAISTQGVSAQPVGACPAHAALGPRCR